MPQGYKHEEMTLSELCSHINTAFNEYAVINLINDRQQEGYLSDIEWKLCEPCQERLPFDTDASCLVCGSLS
jgi:hypothetical protein